MNFSRKRLFALRSSWPFNGNQWLKLIFRRLKEGWLAANLLTFIGIEFLFNLKFKTFEILYPWQDRKRAQVSKFASSIQITSTHFSSDCNMILELKKVDVAKGRTKVFTILFYILRMMYASLCVYENMCVHFMENFSIQQQRRLTNRSNLGGTSLRKDFFHTLF